jgi:hypothetical protein
VGRTLILAATRCIAFKSTARGAPYLLVDISIDGDADIFEKRVEKSFGARGERQKFRVDGRSHDRPVSEGRVKPGAGWGIQGIVPVPNATKMLLSTAVVIDRVHAESNE